VDKPDCAIVMLAQSQGFMERPVRFPACQLGTIVVIGMTTPHAAR